MSTDQRDRLEIICDQEVTWPEVVAGLFSTICLALAILAALWLIGESL